MNCAVCGTEFTPKSKRQRCCKPECSGECRRRANQKWAADHREQIKKYQRERHLRLYAADPERFKRKSREYRLAHRDEVRTYQRDYQRKLRAADPEKRNAEQRAYYVKNAAKMREKARRHYRANREKLKTRSRMRYAANREGYQEYSRRRRANPEWKKQERLRRSTPEFRERARLYGRKYFAADPEKFRERGRQYYWHNPEKQREKARLRARALRAKLAKLKPKKPAHRPQSADTPYRITIVANCRLQGLNDYKITSHAYPLNHRNSSAWRTMQSFLRRNEAAIEGRMEQLANLPIQERGAVVEQAKQRLRTA